ncbi:hypothetical protein XELAEV_18027267mg, partial [Xenopus laevis]
MASSAESPQSVLEWCKSLGLNPKKTAVVGQMIPRTKEEVIYKILDADGSIYKPRVDPNPLCTGAPRLPAAGHSPVTKRLFEVMPETKLKYTALCESLNSAGRNPPLSDVFETAQLVEVLAQVGENLRQLAYNGNYKRLKFFSGMEPTPPGEETFAVWRDSALTTVADWPGSGPALCHKIPESLRGPALDLIKLHREVCPQDGPEKLIELLGDTYGPVEDEIEMLQKFQSCMQQDKESLSEYLKRLQHMLKLLVCRRIIATDRIDSMRLKQLFQGALTMDPTDIRREEVNVLRREKKNRSSEKTSSDSLKEEIAELKKEIAKLKAGCFLCGWLGHISTNCNKQHEEVAAAEVSSSGCNVKKLPQKRYRKRRSQVKYYTCGWYSHTSRSCDWGLNEESYDGYVTSFPCEVDIPEEKSCLMRMVSEHSGTPDNSERLGLGKRKPSGRGNVRVVSEKVFPSDSPPVVKEPKW